MSWKNNSLSKVSESLCYVVDNTRICHIEKKH